MNRFFHNVIEAHLETIHVLSVVHFERHGNRDFRITQAVNRNVLTEFDRKLSRHLAATQGMGFPAFTVTVEVADVQSGSDAHHLASSHHLSVPHALKEIAERAVNHAGPTELTLYHQATESQQPTKVVHRRRIGATEIKMLDAALEICRHLGAGEFLEISGDFSGIATVPPEGMRPFSVDLLKGTVLMPSSPLGANAAFEWPIGSFYEYASTNLAAQGYLTHLRQALVARREAAILEFRAAAEQRILDFDRALSGRRVEGHWLEAAQGLVARLTAGLGDTLAGLSEHSRGIAMDWLNGVGSTDAEAEANFRMRTAGEDRFRPTSVG